MIVGEGETMSAEQFLQQVVENVPESETRSGIRQAVDIPGVRSPAAIAKQLGAGYKISAQDTVPFVLWCAAHHLDDYEEAFWATISGLGDMDTTCAIAGGIVALSARVRGIPTTWLEAREPFPDDFLCECSPG